MQLFHVLKSWRRFAGFILLGGFLLLIGSLSGYAAFFGPADKEAHLEEFLVNPDEGMLDVALALEREGYVKNAVATEFALFQALGGKSLRPGGYKLSASMDAWSIADTLTRAPYLAWITIPRGYRKEQIANLLVEKLGWTPGQKQEWLSADTNSSLPFSEGVYYPDTYLISPDETPARVADRLRNNFENVYNSLVASSTVRDYSWSQVVTIASLIDREAAGPHDMPLIAGVIYNRLRVGMPLGIDATLQYIKGQEGNWWPVVHGEDKYLKSPFNTYFKPGLPPAPIDNPRKEALYAALNPQKTTCMFYLHDYHGQIHCSVTYAAHVANINTYLK